jgi:hypothetical protein
MGLLLQLSWFFRNVNDCTIVFREIQAFFHERGRSWEERSAGVHGPKRKGDEPPARQLSTRPMCFLGSLPPSSRIINAYIFDRKSKELEYGFCE